MQFIHTQLNYTIEKGENCLLTFRNAAFLKAEEGLIHTDVAPVCTIALLAASRCPWKLNNRQLFTPWNHRYMCNWIVRSFICPSFFFFSFTPQLSTARSVLFSQSIAIFFLQAAVIWRSMHPAWRRAISNIPDAHYVWYPTSCLYSSADVPSSAIWWVWALIPSSQGWISSWHRREYGPVWMRQGTPYYNRNYGVRAL